MKEAEELVVEVEAEQPREVEVEVGAETQGDVAQGGQGERTSEGPRAQ